MASRKAEAEAAAKTTAKMEAAGKYAAEVEAVKKSVVDAPLAEKPAAGMKAMHEGGCSWREASGCRHAGILCKAHEV